MTTRNNFTRPESGPAIELTAFRDTDMARRDFDESMVIMQHEGYSTFTKAYYVDCGNVPGPDGITFSLKGANDAIKAALIIEGYEGDESDAFDILESAYGERITLLNYQDFNNVFAPLEAVPSKDITWVKIRGCCQGDYAEVAYCAEDLESAWGNTPDESELCDIFTHLFYDAPVYARFEIDGTEYSYCEYMPDSYNWDREAFAAHVSKASGVPAETLLAMLPIHLEY